MPKLTEGISMKLCIVSNYINHHQIPMANELYKMLGDDFTFIQTSPMEEDRVKMGWGNEVNEIPYLKIYYEQPDECADIILNYDIVVFGGVEDESYIKPRLDAKKTVIRASERLYREGQWKAVSPRGLKKKYEDHTRYRKDSVYLLCHGAYVASDFNIVRAYPQKKFVWGYFPQVYEYDIDELFHQKNQENDNGKHNIRLLWAGRFMQLKHPEYAIEAAMMLYKNNISFHLDMVGGGDMENELKSLTNKYGIEKYVQFHGFKNPTEVREFMEKADIFMFTSNYLEGWGAVVNEAMNSACAVVAGHGAGAVPFLIKHGYNGMVYKNEDINEFKDYVMCLANNSKLRKKLGINAYNTIIKEWNPKEAADRLYHFCEGLMRGEVNPQKEGPLSMAPDISPKKGYKYSHLHSK